MVKCSECGLIFNSVEKMSFHYFEIHEKNKKEKNDNKEWRRQTKPQVEKEVEKNNNKEKKNIELEERYSKWIEMRMGNKNDEAKKKEKEEFKRLEDMKKINDLKREEEMKETEEIIKKQLLKSNEELKKKRKKKI